MKIKIFLSTALLLGLLSGSLQAQYNITGCEQVTGLQSLWDTLLEVSAGGSFVNTGTVEYSRVRSLVNHGGFSEQFDGAACTAGYPDPCGGAGIATSTFGLNVFGNQVASTRISGSQALRMYAVQLDRNIQLDNEWQIAGNLSWSSGLVTTDRSDLSHYLHFLDYSAVTGAGATKHVDGYAAWSGAGDFTLPTGDGGKLGQVGLAGSCGNTFKAAYFKGNPGSASLPTGAPFSPDERGTGLCAVSDKEYWDVDGSASTSITLHFDAASGLADIAASTSELVVAGWDGTKWVSLGSAAVSGTLAGGGSVTSDPVVPGQYTAFTFGVYDDTAPVPSCQDVTVTLDATGNGSTTATAVDNGSTDNCAIATLTLDITAFDCSHTASGLEKGAAPGNTVTLTVTDVHGNSATCTATVTVQDNTAPAIQCQNVTVTLDAQGNASTTATAVDNGTTDACGIASRSLSKTSFTCPDAGANTVSLTVTDNNGNQSTCTATVTVVDNAAPVALCKNVTVSLDAQGNGSTTATAVDNGSTDICGIASRSLSKTSFNCSDVGTVTVTLTVTDPSGNSSACTATVTVEDKVAPAAQCLNATRVLNALGNRIVLASEVNNNSTDACGIAAITLSQTAFNCSHLGPNPVTLTVTDVNGNSSTCSATVTILDGTPPVAFCKNASVVLNAQGSATLAASAVNNNSTDACGISSLALSQSAFTCADLGQKPVTLTVTDPGGNTNTCSATVTVTDNTAPVAKCKPATLQLGANGTATALASEVDDNSTDACGIATRALSQSGFTCTQTGPNPVTLTVTDASGNSSSCTTTITVVDLLLPDAKCKNATAYLDISGQVQIPPSLVNNASSDNCGIAGLSLSKTSFDCSNLGANVVTLTATDASGNSKSCSATVVVADNLPPALVCQDLSVQVNAQGVASITASQVFNAAASSDNCGAVSLLGVSTTQFYCANVGANTVTLTAGDGHGNTASCQATVTVQGLYPVVDVAVTPEFCASAPGTITVTLPAVNGQAAYSLDGGSNWQFSNVFGQLSAGTYTVSVNIFGTFGCGALPVQVTVPLVSELVNTWTGAGDGLHWTDAQNWSLAVAPLDCHQVVIPGEKSVLLRSGEVGNGFTLDVQSGGVLTMESSAELNINQ